MGIFSILKKSNSLYYPGCTTYFKFPENYELYKKILGKLGIDFRDIDFKEFNCCGLKARELGYEVDARKLAKK